MPRPLNLPASNTSVSITDAQSHYNVTNLVDRTKGIIDPFEFAAFERLCQNLGVDAAVASLIASGLRDAAMCLEQISVIVQNSDGAASEAKGLSQQATTMVCGCWPRASSW